MNRHSEYPAGGCATVQKSEPVLPLFNNQQQQDGFSKFDRDNPKVWELFVKFTNEIIRAGYERFSSDSILHRIRWETAISTTDKHFKINNNFSADYARKYMKENPQYDGFFEIRKRHYVGS